MNGENREKAPVQNVFDYTVITTLGKIGCFTFVIAATALFGGIWLDNQLGTRPWLMLALFILSVPIVTFVIIRVTTSSTRHLRSTPSGSPKNINEKEETNRE
jgi:hypothetical protein